jgi:hypothetical protein
LVKQAFYVPPHLQDPGSGLREFAMRPRHKP